jgi:hypothetical protein
VTPTSARGPALSQLLALAFFGLSVIFVWRSFYGMRIRSGVPAVAAAGAGGRMSEVARGK